MRASSILFCFNRQREKQIYAAGGLGFFRVHFDTLFVLLEIGGLFRINHLMHDTGWRSGVFVNNVQNNQSQVIYIVLPKV